MSANDKPPEMSKGFKMALGLIGITPEMLASPEALLRAFGIDPEKVTKPIAQFEQIGVSMMRAMAENNARLARIEKQLGIPDPIDAGSDLGTDGAGGDGLRDLGRVPPDRRN